MKWKPQPCRYCKTLIYWNVLDKTFKETGSWHEWDSGTLHDYTRCQSQLHENKIQNQIMDDLLDERGLRF